MSRKQIAILMASVEREYQADFAKAAFAAAREHDADICVFNCQGYMNVDTSASTAGESSVFDLARIRRFDGIISLRATFAEDTLRKVEDILREAGGTPHISIDVKDDSAVTIGFDDAVSVRELTEHLITRHGVRRLAYLSGPQNQEVALNRLRACREAAEACGAELREEDIFEGEWVHHSGVLTARKLLERGEPLPDAILCGNDDMAFGVTETLGESGYRVPEDVLVTGFDALRESISRGLTTIRRPIDEAARRAVALLCGWIDGEAPEEKTVTLPTVLIRKDSCGCGFPREQAASPSRRLMRNNRRKTENILLQISSFYGMLVGSSDLEDAHRKLDQLVNALGIRELYLCVDPELTVTDRAKKADFAYPEEMQLLYGRKEERLFPLMPIRTELLVPVMEEKRDRPLELVFCPLYFRERNFGYLAMEMGAADGPAIYSILMLLNGALMSLYMQSSLRRYARKVEDMSVTDIMTGMQNRRGFMEKSPRVLERAMREARVFVVLSADMDSMKMINDRYGHQAGDQAIIRIGNALRKLEALGMIPVHISGDEFLAYGTADSPEDAGKLLNLARNLVREQNVTDPWIVNTDASIGMFADVPRDGDTIDQFLTRADRAMYEEKARRKELARNTDKGSKDR